MQCELDPDVLFAIGTTTEQQHRLAKKIVIELAGRLKISSSHSQAGIIQFNREATLEHKLARSKSTTDFQSVVDRLRFQGPVSSIKIALQKAYHEGFQQQNGMRVDSQQVLVLISDLFTQAPSFLQPELDQFKEAGIEVIAIGLGNVILPKALLNELTQQFVLEAAETHATREVLDGAAESICRAAGTNNSLCCIFLTV